jgi:hypothetical protein
MTDKKLCTIVKNGLSKDSLKDYEDLVRGTKYVCKKCGRAAARRKHLCKPKKL